MSKSKKKRLREAIAASAPSPNGVESDVSASASASASTSASVTSRPDEPTPSKSSTPIQSQKGSATSTPVRSSSSGDAASNNGDQSTWSKSKKKRMKQKAKKEAAKRLLMVAEGGGGGTAAKGANGRTNNENSSGKKFARGVAIDNGNMNATSPCKSSSDSGNIGGDGNSKKRQRTNDSADRVKSSTETKKQAVAINERISPRKKEKRPSTPSLAHEHGENDISKNSSTNPVLKNDTGSPLKSSESSRRAANGIIPKKKKKKKKKSTATQQQSSTAEAEKFDQNKEGSEKKPVGANVISNDNKNNSVNTARSNGLSNGNNKQKLKITLPKPSQMSTLQRAFLERLTSSRFRELNEELYTHSSRHSFEHFTEHPELFDQYHVGFRKQVLEWPTNPVDVIYKKIVNGWKNDRGGAEKKGEKNGKGDMISRGGEKKVVVADFGCGDAKLAERLLALQAGSDGRTLTQAAAKKKKTRSKDQQQTSLSCPFEVFSFDLVAGGNPLVTAADMSDVPLRDESVDVAVYCLALMGTNVADFVREAWRVLVFGGTLRVAEVRSRFETASAGTSAAGEAGTKGRGGGKRWKLNNGKKHYHPKKKVNNPDDDDNKSPQQPLMLLDEFISLMERCGFQSTNMDRSNKMFLFMDFVKANGSKGLSDKERFTAKPCIYKRR